MRLPGKTPGAVSVGWAAFHRMSADSRAISLLGAPAPGGAIRWRPGERLEHLFERRCDELAEQGREETLAVDGPAGRLTYAELDRRANQLARFLARRHGLGPGDRVALVFDAPVLGYVGMLAVLKLGAAFVPLDPGFPADRLAYITEDAGVAVLLSESSLDDLLGELPREVRVVRLDELSELIATEPDERPPAPENGGWGDLCYVIYTSGTTGRPKGVRVGHPSICNFVRVAAEVYGLRRDDRIYQGLTIAFDFSFEEIWVGWMVGATLVPRLGAVKLIGPELHDFLSEQRITALCCVPSLLATLDEPLPGLRFLLVSGEPCPQELVERWHRPGLRFLNTYGPTEATVSATWALVEPSKPVTIGVPLPTYCAVVLHPEENRALPPGESGEIGLAGIGLAEGYLGRPDLTDRAFIEDFLSIPDNPSRRIYRTGDLGRINELGEIEHQGRIDAQVKVRGYRIELGEIESVLARAPGVAQCAVAVHELRPGEPELVGYYRPREGDRPDPARIYEVLRDRLPAYMVPAHLERIARVPLTTTGKIDRGALPPPSGARRLATDGEYAPPQTELEELMATILADVLRVDRVSTESDFFDDLGANSLLMAGFNAHLRRRDVAVSMKDVYLHRTIRGLAAAVAESDPGAEAGWVEPSLPAPTGTPHHRLCGALQALIFISYAFGVAVGLSLGASWLAAAGDAADLYLRAVGFGAALLAATGLLPIAAKWILIGRFRRRRIRAWSFAYVRFWVVKTLAIANPVAHLIVGTPLYSLYLRAMGARVGRRALVLSHRLPVCTDLITIGDDAVIRKETYLNGYRARSGLIEMGPVTIGRRAFVGQGTVCDIDTAVGDDAEVAHASSLQAGQAVPAGEVWHGSPAEPAPAGARYRTVPGTRMPSRRPAVYGAGRLISMLAVVGPLEAALVTLLFTPQFNHLGVAIEPLVAAVLLVAALLAATVAAVAVPRLLTRALVPGRVYPLYGLRHAAERTVARFSSNPLLTGLFGDSSAIPHYLRLTGWRLDPFEQTGSNFGMDVKQEVPGLCAAGTGTMVSDGLSMMNTEFSSTAFRVMPSAIGSRSFLGNAIHYPSGSRVGDNCLLATKVMVPISGPSLENVGLLGSPAFEIPRTVRRDGQFEDVAAGPERDRRLGAKLRHNLVSMGLHLLLGYLLLLGVFLIDDLAGRLSSGLWAEEAAIVAELAFAVALLVLAERAVLGFRSLQPRFCSIYDPQFWSHERYWKLSSTAYLRMFDGTPFKPVIWRLLGVRVGRRIFDDGLRIIEKTLVEIGDESTFNMGVNLQAHSLEDGTFKSDRIAIGAGCTVGTAALINYGAVLEDRSIVEADSFLMKGSRVEAGRRWRGNPATELQPEVA